MERWKDADKDDPQIAVAIKAMKELKARKVSPNKSKEDEVNAQAAYYGVTISIHEVQEPTLIERIEEAGDYDLALAIALHEMVGDNSPRYDEGGDNEPLWMAPKEACAIYRVGFAKLLQEYHYKEVKAVLWWLAWRDPNHVIGATPCAPWAFFPEYNTQLDVEHYDGLWWISILRETKDSREGYRSLTTQEVIDGIVEKYDGLRDAFGEFLIVDSLFAKRGMPSKEEKERAKAGYLEFLAAEEREAKDATLASL
jgi:hypothetical protein